MTEPQAAIIAATIAAAAALFGACLTSLVAKRQQKESQQIAELQRHQDRQIAQWQQHKKADELFLTALEFLGGQSQRRNLGIGAIRLYWKDYPEHQRLCIELLIGTAIYLLGESGQKDASHEIYNLKRIMNLILKEIPYDSSEFESYMQLHESLDKWKPKSDKGLHLDTKYVEGLKTLLTQRMAAAKQLAN